MTLRSIPSNISGSYVGLIGKFIVNASFKSCVHFIKNCFKNGIVRYPITVMNKLSSTKVEQYNPCIQIKACIKTEKAYKQGVH